MVNAPTWLLVSDDPARVPGKPIEPEPVDVDDIVEDQALLGLACL